MSAHMAILRVPAGSQRRFEYRMSCRVGLFLAGIRAKAETEQGRTGYPERKFTAYGSQCADVAQIQKISDMPNTAAEELKSASVGNPLSRHLSPIWGTGLLVPCLSAKTQTAIMSRITAAGRLRNNNSGIVEIPSRSRFAGERKVSRPGSKNSALTAVWHIAVTTPDGSLKRFFCRLCGLTLGRMDRLSANAYSSTTAPSGFDLNGLLAKLQQIEMPQAA